MPTTNEVRRTRHRAVEQLLALRDEAKLQLHLLGLDARHALADLETRILTLEADANREGEQAAELLKTSLHELTRAMNEFMTSHINASLGLLTNVRALMSTPVHSCQAGASLNDAAQLMWSYDCGALPVLDDGRVVGVVTDRDICMATYTQGKPPAELPIAGAMSHQVFSCAPDDSLAMALGLMSRHRVRRLPVVSADGALLGLLSLADIVRWGKRLSNVAVDAALTDTLAAIGARPLPQPAAAE
jgi:CBS domain-containing protein